MALATFLAEIDKARIKVGLPDAAPVYALYWAGRDGFCLARTWPGNPEVERTVFHESRAKGTFKPSSGFDLRPVRIRAEQPRRPARTLNAWAWWPLRWLLPIPGFAVAMRRGGTRMCAV
jgi:hypothetical protein